MAANDGILSIENLSVSYGRIAAVRNVSLEARQGEIVGLVGANGAGKSTIMKAALGVQRASAGRVRFLGQDVTDVSTEKIVASGLVYVPEGGGVLPWMTILENLQLGALHFKGNFAAQLRHVFDRFPILEDRQRQLAGTLSGGEQEMLAISRGLMSRPKLLLLDEPSLGLSPIIIEELTNIIKEINERGISVLLVEQNAGLVTEVTKRGYVLEVGKIVLEGNITELMENKSVQRAFIGG